LLSIGIIDFADDTYVYISIYNIIVRPSPESRKHNNNFHTDSNNRRLRLFEDNMKALLLIVQISILSVTFSIHTHAMSVSTDTTLMSMIFINRHTHCRGQGLPRTWVPAIRLESSLR
jgi:hypothetical protein